MTVKASYPDAWLFFIDQKFTAAHSERHTMQLPICILMSLALCSVVAQARPTTSRPLPASRRLSTDHDGPGGWGEVRAQITETKPLQACDVPICWSL